MRYFIALILLVSGFGCQAPSHKTQPVRINIGDEPQTLDPRKAKHLNCQMISRMLFEGLTRVSREEKVELALAESVEISPDQKTYTFRLKKSVWSNADPVTAFDFVYAWKKVLSPDFPSNSAEYLYAIQNAKAAKEGKIALDLIGVHAQDENTLVVQLQEPTPYFLELTAFPAFFPINQSVDTTHPTWAQSATHYVCNGPFCLTDWKHQDHLSLKKNTSYWDAATVKIASLALYMLAEETELNMFEKKELDWAGSPFSTLPVDALTSLEQDKSLHTKELLGTYFIRINTDKAPFAHPAMRKAFALAVDRSAIVAHITRGKQIPATGLVPPSLGLQKQPYFQDADQERAKQLFSSALSDQHLTKDKLPEITLLYRAGERNHSIAQAIQQQWFEAFGVRIKLEAIERKVFYDRISRQDYHLAAGDWIADFADPINFLDIFKYKKGGSNNTHWENPQYTALLDQAAISFDQTKRLSLLAHSEQILMQEMPIIPIFYYTMLYVNQPHLKDVALSSMGQIDFKWAEYKDVR